MDLLTLNFWTPQIENLETRVRGVLNLIPSLWNALRPVNRLLPEIISSIARYYVQDGRISYQIIPLTHVSRYWRNVIISTPDHWTSISAENSGKLVGLSLERSLTAPLDIRLNMHRFREYNWFLDLLRPKIQNAGSLTVLCPQGVEDIATAFPDFTRSMPNLRSLKIVKGVGPDWDRSVDPFGPSACSLRCLTLVQIPLYPSFLTLRTLTTLNLGDAQFHLHLDTLLDFLEKNHSLQSVALKVSFVEPSLCSSQHQSPIRNLLQHLTISCIRAIEVQTLISNIALQRGAHLELIDRGWNAGLNEILTGISTAHLSNLLSPTSVEYETYLRRIRLSGPDGGFSFRSFTKDPFVGFPLLTLANVREFRLINHELSETPRLSPITHYLSFFPSLKTLAVECETNTPYLSTLLSNPPSSPSLTTLAFFNCGLSESFMEELTRFASDRKNTTSSRLHRVVIVDSGGKFPSAASIDALEKHVPIVDVRRGKKLPTDLT